MNEQREVVILSGVRTAIGDYGGSLKDIPPSELGAQVVREAVSRAKVDPKDIGQCMFGNVIHTEAKDMYISRVAALKGGLPAESGALTVNRLCGSGMQAIVSASQSILLGDVDAAVAGGAESMSRGAYANGTGTAGNASGINDAAAAVVLMEKSVAAKKGLKPMARLVSYGHAGVDPKIMGLGPVSAVKSALAKAGLKLEQMDVIESNEAFAAQALGVSKELGMNPAKVNPNGGAVALGHPIGATGCILTVKAMYELHRTGGRYGLITMCIGGGQGIAAIIERV